MTWVVVPAEMNILGGRPSTRGEVARVVDSLLCIGWDAETAAAAGWPTVTPAGEDSPKD